MQFLGLSHLAPSAHGHDTATALLNEDFNLFAVSEDRFSRIKNDGSYPSGGIQSCLKQSNLRLSEIDKISVGWGLAKERISRRVNEQFCCYAKESTFFQRSSMGKKDPPFYDHQYTHARTAYALSGFKKSLVISLDGGGLDNGKFNSGGIFVADNGNIQPIEYFPLNVSLGNTYGAITEICGFTMVDGEGKTMTLSPLGEKYPADIKDKIYGHMCKVLPDFDGTTLRTNSHVTIYGEVLHDFLWYSVADIRLLLLKRLYHKNLIGWAGQKRLEEIVIKIISDAVDSTGITNVAFTGGVFLNMIMNMKIQQKFGKKLNLFFNPICNDVGNAVGAALEQCYQETGKNPIQPYMSLYLGNSYSDEEVVADSKKFNFKITEVNKTDSAIDLIERGKVIGWFQGRAEFGPRGLGNRSILSLATEQKYKDTVNEKVKKREAWRPFCPTIIEEKRDEILKDATYAPYMILGFDMKNPELYPAVCHIDGTTRPQILKKEVNPDFHKVVKGVGGIVLNTSFNLAGDPVVETPYDAFMTLKNSEMDAVIINNFLVEKNK